MVVQVNGKVRDRIEVAAGIDEAEAERLALAAVVQPSSMAPSRRGSSSAPPKLVNIVV